MRVLDPVAPEQFAGDVEALRDFVRARIVTEKQRIELT
jgi:hypothetical protein